LFKQQLADAQNASERQAKEEGDAREAAFVASARLEPLATFVETSPFLVRFDSLFCLLTFHSKCVIT
jgi:hypothetical protein